MCTSSYGTFYGINSGSVFFMSLAKWELKFWFLVSASILRQARLGASGDHDLDDIPKFFGLGLGFRDEFTMCSERSEAAMDL